MVSSVVFKVKYGDTLRRFNASVNEEHHFDVNMLGLRLKICSLFNLPSNANFSLTYRDDDNDLVTLDNDEELNDVLRQGLNPVRIIVDLKTDKTTPADLTSGASSTPRESSPLNLQQNAFQNIQEVLNSLPAPCRDAVLKISTEMATKAASTSPILAELMDGLSKLSNTEVVGRAGGSDGPKQGAPNGKSDTSIDEGVKHNDTTSNSVHQSPKSSQATKEAEPKKSFPPYTFSHDGKNTNSGNSFHKLSTSKSSKKNDVNGNSAGTFAKPQCFKDFNDNMKKHTSSKKETIGLSFGDNRSLQFGGCSSNAYIGRCPLPRWSYSPVQKFQIQTNPPINKVDGLGHIFHKGVRCDGCGVLPITGPRFNSKVKHDYDLCNICFAQMGNSFDYTRIDYPLLHRHPLATNRPFDLGRARHADITLEGVPLMMSRPAGKQARSRFDSRFVVDINIMDGTVMAPLTPFTKIWRMHNTGTEPWKSGVKLLWIGGDRFSASDLTEVEQPVKVVDVRKQTDVAVDFVAPEIPGEYVSYWRMAEPCGHQFGQRVWVSIKVDASMDLTNQCSNNLDLNLHPETTGALDPQVDDSEPAKNLEAEDSRFSSLVVQAGDLCFPINDDLLVASDLSYPTPAATSSSPTSPNHASNSASPSHSDNTASPVASTVLNPDVTTDVNHEPEPPSAPPANLYPAIPAFPAINMFDISSASGAVANNDKNDLVQDQGNTSIEETLLKELEVMGFKEIDLNKRVLRVNNYDLEQSLDDLCGVSEWDPMLVELQEMGFKDKETNKKLLAKNNGSITRVVMDLIAREAPKE